MGTGGCTVNQVALTGIKPTGSPHIGNYLGMIRPAITLAQNCAAIYFIADYHALTAYPGAQALQEKVYDVAATWLALGLDPDRVVFFRQSAVAEIFELTWILACHTPKGLLNRAHAYKAAVDANTDRQRDADDGVNAGLFSYPLLMAADILLFNADSVPVGQDQQQHIEIARDIAAGFNHRHGAVFKQPQALIGETTGIVPGVDGRKMSKSYRNTLPIFAEPAVLKKQVMRIVTDASRPEDPKDPEKCNVFKIYRHFAAPEDVSARRRAYLRGGLAYSEIKQELAQLLEDTFALQRARYTQWIADKEGIDRVLTHGAARARSIARPFLNHIRDIIGID
jgi:tryptophanyl-tRNA synthetase